MPKQLQSIDMLEDERTSYYPDGRIKEREIRTLTRLNFRQGVGKSNPDPPGLGDIVVGGVVLALAVGILGAIFSNR